MENLSLTIYWIISSFTPSCIIRKKKPLMPSPILAVKLQEPSPPLFPSLWAERSGPRTNYLLVVST